MGLSTKKRARKSEKSQHVDEEPKLKKPTLFMLSSNHNNETKKLLKDLYQISREHSVFRQNNSNKNEWQESSLKLSINPKNHRLAESVCNKLTYGLYVVANSNKKRPINFGFGRMYNRAVLDCCQLKVDKFVPMEAFKSELEKVNLNSRPLIITQGSEFSQDSGPLTTVRNILLDVFRGPSHPKVSLENIKQVIVFTILDEGPDSPTKPLTNGTAPHADGSKPQLNGTSHNDSAYGSAHLGNKDSEKEEKGPKSHVFPNPPRLLFRRYSISLVKPQAKKPSTSSTSDTDAKNALDLKLPNVRLTEIGPSIDFLVEEVMEPDPEAFKSATKLPKKPKKLVAGTDATPGKQSTKRKNVKTTGLGNVEGKVYVNRQDLDDLYTPHTKKMRRLSKK